MNSRMMLQDVEMDLHHDQALMTSRGKRDLEEPSFSQHYYYYQYLKPTWRVPVRGLKWTAASFQADSQQPSGFARCLGIDRDHT
jgi:hypothetical protein